MKTLHLLRHAKTAAPDSRTEDIDRPLTGRGINDCALMAEALTDTGIFFSDVYCSPARRARDTLQLLQQHGLDVGNVSVVDALYTFNHRDLLDFLAAIDPAIDHVLLIGHNPGFTDLCNQLGDSPLDDLATCGYVCIELPVSDWDLRNELHTGDTMQYLYPALYQ